MNTEKFKCCTEQFNPPVVDDPYRSSIIRATGVNCGGKNSGGTDDKQLIIYLYGDETNY